MAITAPPPRAAFGAGSALAIRWATIPPQVAIGVAATVEAVVTVEEAEEGAMAVEEGAAIKDLL
jgi:hypothetical protein